MNEPKLDLLVLPDLFPKDESDLQGIFILDYLKATEKYCNTNVLSVKISGSRKGLFFSKIGSANITRYFFSTGKASTVLKPIYYLLWFLKAYKLGCSFSKTNIIHCHGTILNGTLGWLLSKKFNVPFIITEHLGPFSIVTESRWKFSWTKFILEKADLVLCVSDHQKNEILASGIAPRKMLVSYNPVDTDLFKVKEDLSFKKFLFAGRLDPFKGALRTLQSFQMMAKKYPEWSFSIVGDGEERGSLLKFLMENEFLKSRVTLYGYLNKQQLAEMMQEHDFFVFPSLNESFCLVVAEAMSCGLPVITTNTTAPKEFVGSAGILVTPDSIEEISVAIEKMILTFNSYNSQQIHQIIEDRFSFRIFGEFMYNCYKSVIIDYK